MTGQRNTRTAEGIMQTDNGAESEQFLNMDHEAAPEPPVQGGDATGDPAAVSDLLAVAEEFNAAFHTALYELEASRKRVQEHSDRIHELNKSIESLNTALEAQISEAGRKDEAHARETEAFNRTIRELESERDGLRQQGAEQQTSLNQQADEIRELTSRVAELSASLEEHKAESVREAEAFAREREESAHTLVQLQEKYDSSVEQLSLLHGQLEDRNSAVARLSEQVDALSAEVASLTEAGRREQEAHSEESRRLQAELQALNDAVVNTEGLLQQSNDELAGRHREIASLNERTSELGCELEAQSAKMREEAESHLRVCGELNDRISRISSERESMKVIHDELVAHVEKLEQLNRALHDSSVSENDVHRKVVREKDAAIAALQAKLEAMRQEPSIPAGGTAADADLRTAMNELERRLEESESQARMLAERARTAGELEARIEQLTRELQAPRENPDATVVSFEGPAHNPHDAASPLITDRDRFISRLDTLLAEQGDCGASHTLMYVLLDNFIRVRDEIGVLNSEQVVEEISTIIESCCDGNDMIARFGDCTFSVLCNGASAEDTKKKAEQVRSIIENHIFEAAGRTLVTSTSIGICAVRGSDSGAEQVISRADLACESARLSGGNQVVVNSAGSDEPCLPGGSPRHAEIVDKVLGENRITIYYQPISHLKENLVNCFEVLTRVVDENSDIILPGEFFSMAANAGRAPDVDRHLIERALGILAEKPNPDIKLFIKLTRESVCCDALPQWISDKLDEYRINPGQLVFEVAERVMKRELKNLSRLSMALNKIGCKIAIEHYRLETKPQHLNHVHPDYLKIDSGLVQNIAHKGPGLAKLNEIIDLARLNNLITIAEGVESPACLAILWELGVSLAQGYFIAEPAATTDLDSNDVDVQHDGANEGKATYTIG
jgi:diguanylate cyclase (GGDEF)-like protein